MKLFGPTHTVETVSRFVRIYFLALSNAKNAIIVSFFRDIFAVVSKYRNLTVFFYGLEGPVER